MITNGYKQLYIIIYGANKYDATDTNDTKTIILAPEMNALLEVIFSRWGSQWHWAGKGSTGAIIKLPDFFFSTKDKKEIKALKRTILKNKVKITRLWNDARADRQVIT